MKLFSEFSECFALQRKLCYHAILGAVCCSLVACQEVRHSDVPLSREEALQKAGIKLPLPSTAKNIRFHLSGSTQNWNLYLSFEAPLADTEKTIQKELSFYSAREKDLKSGLIEEYPRKPISPEALTPKIKNAAPRWWLPTEIKKGYFIGSSDPHSGPRFWVDTDTSQVFFFEHF